MNPHELCIRPVLPGDNQALARVIRGVLIEMGVPEEGTALADTSLERMYETYQMPRSSYWVVSDASEIWGGGGIAPLLGADSSVCELQKMYFNKELRGLGWGDRLIRKAMDRARALGFERMYLETMPYMIAAQNLYRRHGFRYLDHSLGTTGHSACTVWMEKEFDLG
jgi:putative acetyltransferase